ncbi:ThuA domain-containing protein [Cohnella massiliensis]|uniref:ThuA domain-containing protein n=1 Tax=Cohnella massiliensis TaxID=1816691 RepID=UPI0009B94BAC|nr:ThuA domain-containing protein [Cohnella massiliensis]
MSAPGKTILAIAGDDYHPEAPIREALEQAIRSAADTNAAGLRIGAATEAVRVRYASAERLLEELAERPAAVVLFKENRINPQDREIRQWMTEEAESAIAAYAEAGGGWLAWHSGLASYRTDGAYVGMLRGYFLHHPERHRPVRYSAEAAGPLAGGFPEGDPGSGSGAANPAASFEFADEHYFVACDEPNTTVFLRSESADGESIAGWAHAYGKGRVCCLTPAHTPEGLLHPGTVGTLGRCVAWIANIG